ncbi:MAG: hypothetical protein KDD92_07615 [Caldilineaceae bacterium]|nr:hypothetical protein [Caldilineaceae bacterium]
MTFFADLHPAVVHFPIAFLLLATGSGLAALFVSSRPELRFLTWVAGALGVAGAAAAALTGFFAQAHLPPDAPYRAVLNRHIGAGLAQFVVYGFLLYRRWIFGSKKAVQARRRAGNSARDLLDDPSARLLTALLLLAGALIVLMGGWSGGRLVFEWGVNVAP